MRIYTYIHESAPVCMVLHCTAVGAPLFGVPFHAQGDPLCTQVVRWLARPYTFELRKELLQTTRAPLREEGLLHPSALNETCSLESCSRTSLLGSPRARRPSLHPG